MADFARSLFSFGGYKTPTVTVAPTPESTPPPSGSAAPLSDISTLQAVMSNSAIASLYKPEAPPKSHNSSQSSVQTLNRFLSKGVGVAAPTTAILNDGFAYGINLAGSKPSSEQLTQVVATSQVLSTSAETVSVMALAGNAPDTAIPRGKLRVTLVEARGLKVTSQAAQPYVVCTFEASEFISHGPESSAPQATHLAVPSFGGTTSRPIAYQRQASTQNLATNNLNAGANGANPSWQHQTTFDVLSANAELVISVYDANADHQFMGQVCVTPQTLVDDRKSHAAWLLLEPRVRGESVGGEIKVRWQFMTTGKRNYGPEDFEVLRLLGKGTFGQVFQVRKKDTERIYAMKVLSKKVIVRKKEVAHTIGERNILVRTALASSFIVGLKFSFQTPLDLYLVTDYMSGGELFWHLQKEGRFAEDRAKFYIAELVLALEHLHENGIVYRDLKPENILLDANGHIALCDFGLSKANLASNGTTNTFCGTTEYLAPEVLLDETGYTKMVDFWSLGVLIFEMCCGWSPFYAENTQQMYKNIAFGKVRFPKEVLSTEGRSFVKGLLNRNPKHRLGATDDARELRAHAFFHDIDWDLLRQKRIPPPFKPHLASELDTSNFDPEFTQTSASVINNQFHLATTPLSPGLQANFSGFTYVDDSAMDDHFHSNPAASHRRIQNSFRAPGSFIPGNPNLPPDEDATIDEDEANNGHLMDIDEDHDMDDDEFGGQFDL